MSERKWNLPIDSRFIFKLLQQVANQNNNQKLYDLLLLNANDGRSFAGIGNRVKNCWWQDHVSFMYQIWKLQDEGIDLEDQLWSENGHKFPLPKNPVLSEYYATEFNKKIQAYENKHVKPRKIEKYIASEVEDHLTFESHVYNVLKECFNQIASDKRRDYIIDFCDKAEIPQFEISRMKEMAEFDDILVYIITQAKENKGKPLTIPLADNAADEERKEWRILSANELGLDPMELSGRILKNNKRLYQSLPDAVSGNQRQWADIFIGFPNFCKFLVDSKGKIQGYFAAAGLTKDQEQQMQQGRFVDSEMDVCFCDQAHTPGDHVLYLLNLSVNPGVPYEKYNALWDELIVLLKKCAREGIYFTRIYNKVFLPEHRAVLSSRGFRFLCNDASAGAVFVHEMKPALTLRVLDEELASLYKERKRRKKSTISESNDELEAEYGFQQMFRLVDELFRRDRLAELKPYFFSDIGLPEDENLLQLGIAMAELLRDILQYAESLLDFLDEGFEHTFLEYSSLMNSALVGASMEQYRFNTENPAFQIRKMGIETVNARAVVAFATIWIEYDKIFVDREDILKLRPYFYERSGCLPPEKDMPAATALTVRLLSAMIIAESLLDRIPNYLLVSYLKYKEMVSSIRIVQKVVSENPFLQDELNW